MFVANATLQTGTLSSRTAKKTGELITFYSIGGQDSFKHNRQQAPLDDQETGLA